MQSYDSPSYCSIPNCQSPPQARGWCSAHYYRWRKWGSTAAAIPVRLAGTPAPIRFWTKVHFTGGCWEWTGAKLSNGYGVFGKMGLAHRYAYEFCIGPIPDGLQLDHLCRVRHCVKPDHLEPVTCRENLLRAGGIMAQRAKRTHCPQGHPYDEANTHITRRNERNCRACDRDNARQKRLLKRPR